VVGHFVLHLARGCTGIVGDDLGLLDGEGRVLQLAHGVKTKNAATDKNDHEQPGGDLVADRIFTNIHIGFVAVLAGVT
jgi:hypothetical protein